MKPLLSVAVLTIFLAVGAEVRSKADELPTVKVAVVRFDRVMNASYDRARLLYASKEALEAIRKANSDMKDLYDEVVVAEDPARLSELESKIQMLRRKVNILRQGTDDGNRNMQVPIREFVVKHFGDKFSIIVEETSMFDRCVSKKNVEVVDITDEVTTQFRKHVDELAGEEVLAPAPAKPTAVRPGGMAP